MHTLTELISRVEKTQHGFTDIKTAADELATLADDEKLLLAKDLFTSEVHQARMLAVFLIGQLAPKDESQLTFLRMEVSRDGDWRVQEILAQAFDHYCAQTGYETALPVIESWLADSVANVRRAASEGLRIWTSKPYFRDHPEAAVRLLGPLHADESEYVRKSVGNALRDISRKHAELVRAELATWDLSNKQAAQTHKLAGKFL